jgi:hypothetical protein
MEVGIRVVFGIVFIIQFVLVMLYARDNLIIQDLHIF